MAKNIQCNNCGANDLTKTGENEYRCNYCQARVVTEDPKMDFGTFFKTFNPNDIHKRTQTTYHAEQTIVKNTSRLGCFIALGTMLLIGFSGALTFFLTRNAGSNPAADATGWALSYTPMVYYAEGSKGPAIWVFTEQNYDWKKQRTLLNIIDPVSKKTLHSETIIAEHSSDDKVASLWDIYSGGRVLGDTIFFTPKDQGLAGYNIYNAKKVIDQQYFTKKIGNELAEAQAYTSSDENYLRVKSADGEEYYYFPQHNSVIGRDTYNKNSRGKSSYRYFFILAGNGDKKSVLRVHQLANEDEKNANFHYTYSEYQKEKKYYSNYYNTDQVDSIPVDHGFFDGEMIYTNDSVFVIKYKANLKESAPWVLGAYNVHGKTLWKVVPAQLDAFKADKKEKLDPEVMLMHNKVIITANWGIKAACCVDIGSGKIEWTYRVEK